MKVGQKAKQALYEKDYIGDPFASDAEFAQAFADAVRDGAFTAEQFREFNDEVTSPTSRDVFGGKSLRVDVKAPSERYSNYRFTGKHAKTGRPVKNEKGQFVEVPSERDMALIGAFMKHRAARDGVPGVTLSEHEVALVAGMYDEKQLWCGEFQGSWRDDIKGTQVKALLSDNTSGGINVNPLWYDQAIIQFPLLYGEIVPFVDLVEVPRSAYVDGASIANPTVSWGTSEGTAVSLFNTTSLVNPLNTTIYPVMVAIEIGRDELSDSIIDLGRYLVENLGQAAKNELDNVCVNGNGTNQPTGILNASTYTIVPSETGASGMPALGDYEGLMFALPKPYRKPQFRPAFFANDTSYRRCRSIPRGSDDAARVLGMDEGSYTVLDQPYLIQQDIPNTTIGFGAMSRYRLYRRLGQEIRYITEGQSLATKNTVLIVMRGRYGGRVMDANAFALMTNAQA